MDSKGSLVDTTIKILPSDKLVTFLKTISLNEHVPANILKLVTGKIPKNIPNDKIDNRISIDLSPKEIALLNKLSDEVLSIKKSDDKPVELPIHDKKSSLNNIQTSTKEGLNDETFLEIVDLEWLYTYLQTSRKNGVKETPYLHMLMEGSKIHLPENKVIKRNPDLEARCVKLRAQQEARDYRKMTKTVDNVRMRYPEDSISYAMKQLNRQLIAIGQFIISIFAGFLFGFRGVEWMVGNLDFGFRLLLGVMCALVIALAEIYFLAKKLNEEYSMPETVQLGGPTQFADQNKSTTTIKSKTKEHED